MTARVTPIECAPWCTDGDGHGDALFPADQTCYGERHRIPASLNDDADALTVIAHRRGGGGHANVCLNVYLRDVDVDVYLTVGQARLLIESLMTVTDQIDRLAER